jgi:hypothetical protein
MAQSEQEVENLRTLLEQHWFHCRHVEGPGPAIRVLAVTGVSK